MKNTKIILSIGMNYLWLRSFIFCLQERQQTEPEKETGGEENKRKHHNRRHFCTNV